MPKCSILKLIFMLSVLLSGLLCYQDARALDCSNFEPGLNHDGSPAVFPGGVMSSAGVDLSGQVITTGNAIARPGLTFKIVSCIQDMINEVTASSLGAISTQLSGVIASLLVLYLMFLAVRILLLDRVNMRSELVIAGLYILAIAFFVLNNGIAEYISVIMKSQEIISGILTSNMNVIPLCDYSNVWMQLDCVMANIFGAYMPGAAAGDSGYGNKMLDAYDDPANLFTLIKMTGGLVGSEIGFLYFVLIVVIVLLLVLAIGQAVVTYIVSIVAVTILAMLSPIFIPMILFEQTKKMFNNWVNLILAYIIQPILILGYLSFMIVVLSFVLDRDCSSTASAIVGKCGLSAIFKDARTNPGDKEKESAWYYVQTYISSVGEKNPQCNDLVRNKEQSCVTGRAAKFLFDEDKQKDLISKLSFLQELLMVAVILFLLFGVLQDVLAEAGRMVNLTANSAGKATSVYNGVIASIFRASERKNKG